MWPLRLPVLPTPVPSPGLWHWQMLSSGTSSPGLLCYFLEWPMAVCVTQKMGSFYWLCETPSHCFVITLSYTFHRGYVISFLIFQRWIFESFYFLISLRSLSILLLLKNSSFFTFTFGFYFSLVLCFLSLHKLAFLYSVSSTKV